MTDVVCSDNFLDGHGDEVDTTLHDIERDITQDLLGIGAGFPKSAPLIGLILEVEWVVEYF